MTNDLISREALNDIWELYKKYQPRLGTNVYEFGVALKDIIDNAPTVEPCYQTTSCLDCKMYDNENHNCPRFCEVIRSAVEEVEKND